MIPFLDLRQINERFDSKFKAKFDAFLDSGYFILGNEVTHFETAYANYCDTTHCIGTANGLDAMSIILKGYIALGYLKEQDEVIVASNTYIATILAVKQAGLTPVLVEPHEQTFNLDSTLIEKALTSRTKVILVTHLYGQLADMDKLKAIATKHNIHLIDDCAQSHGAQDNKGRKSGNLCHASAHSFYPTKNLGALGDAGAITTNDDELATMILKIRNYGFSKKYVADVAGMNSRLDEIQAAFLSEKLLTLDEDNEKRRYIAKLYLNGINNQKVRLPYYNGSKNHVFHLFVVCVNNREKFTSHLVENGVGFNVHYPVPPHKQGALRELNDYSYHISTRIHKSVVSLPCHPLLTYADVKTIIEVVNDYV